MRPTFDSPDEALDALADALCSVDIDTETTDCLGRVLAQNVVADRDSPAADVSAMDGYACIESTLRMDAEVPVIAECSPGQPPPDVTAEQLATGVVRIFTGAIVPTLADRVVKREDTIEIDDEQDVIRWCESARSVARGTHIRFAGENIAGGEPVLAPGSLLQAAECAAMANFGVTQPTVHRRVRVAVLTTGDELIDAGDPRRLNPWQLRNSNAVAIAGLLSPLAFVEVVSLPHAIDEPQSLRARVRDALDHHDVVLMTGGVSMGDHDYVPEVMESLGCEIVFHKLPLRPGKPILGALDRSAGVTKPLLGLPGNPVSATLNTVRFALPIIRRMAGLTNWRPRVGRVSLIDPGDKTLGLHWMRPVRLRHDGSAELMTGRGSGDLVSLCRADGFVVVPPHASGTGPWPMFRWDGN